MIKKLSSTNKKMDNLNNKKISELKDIARQNNLTGFSYHTKKADLIQFIIDNLQHQQEPRSPSAPRPRPRSRSPSPRLRPRSRSPSPRLRPRSRSPSPRVRPRSQSPRYKKLDKKECMTNLRTNIIEVAKDYEISIKKLNGKNKTKQELCDELKFVIKPKSSSTRSSRSRNVSRRKSPIAGPSTEPLVPQIIVKYLINLNDPFTSKELIKRVKKDQLVQYANTLGIMKAKTMTKPIILKNIIDISRGSSSRSSSNRSSSNRSSSSRSSQKSADLILEAKTLINDVSEKIEAVENDPVKIIEVENILEDVIINLNNVVDDVVVNDVDDVVVNDVDDVVVNDVVDDVVDDDNDDDDNDDEILNIEKPLDFVEEEKEEIVSEEVRMKEMEILRNREIPPERVMYIEQLLEEIQQPEEIISNIAIIQRKVFNCLGLVN
jgi:hypothetical protein